MLHSVCRAYFASATIFSHTTVAVGNHHEYFLPFMMCHVTVSEGRMRLKYEIKNAFIFLSFNWTLIFLTLLAPPLSFLAPALSKRALPTYIIGHHCYAWGSTAFILISACFPICKKNEIISPRQTNHLSNSSTISSLNSPNSNLSLLPDVQEPEVRSTGVTRAKLTADVYHDKECSHTKTLIHPTFFRSHGTSSVHPLISIPCACLNKS